MVVMMLRSPRRSLTSQICSGGRPRELAEPVSISTVTGGCMVTWVLVEGPISPAWVLGLRTRQGWAAP